MEPETRLSASSTRYGAIRGEIHHVHRLRCAHRAQRACSWSARGTYRLHPERDYPGLVWSGLAVESPSREAALWEDSAVEFAGFLWMVAGAVFGIAGGSAIGVLGMTPARYRDARILFWVAGLSVLAMAVLFGLTVPVPPAGRIIGTGIVGALAAILIVETTKWVNTLEQAGTLPSVQQSPPILRLADLSDAALQIATLDLASRMRTFEANSMIDESNFDIYFDPLPKDATDEQKQERQRLFQQEWSKMSQRRSEHHTRKEIEFRNSFAPRGRELRTIIEARLRAAGKLSPYMPGKGQAIEHIGTYALERGHLAGPNPVTAAADYLETIARRLTD